MSQKFLTNDGLDCHGGSDGIPDAQLVPTTRGQVRADQVKAATPASLEVPGESPDGLLTYAAAGGRWGNAVSVIHQAGSVGPGNENRPLSVEVDPLAKSVTVTFGTDGSGASLAPSAAEVSAELQSKAKKVLGVSASPGGDGTGSVGLGSGLLAGGLNDGDHLRLGPGGKYSKMINTKVST